MSTDAVLIIFGDIDFKPMTCNNFTEMCVVESISLSMYLSTDSIPELQATCKKIQTQLGVKGYVIPSWYLLNENNDLSYAPELINKGLPSEFPSDYSWETVEEHLPYYSSSEDVAFNNRLQCYFDGHDIESTDEDYIIPPNKSIDVRTWGEHMLFDSNRRLFNLAIEARDI